MDPRALANDTQRIMDAFRRVFRSVRLTSRASEKALGLSSAQLFVLQSLASSANVSLGELAALTHTDQSSVSVVVSRLVRRGLVRREINAHDARRLELSLTARGEGVVAAAPPPLQASLLSAIQDLDGTSRRDLADLIERVIDKAGLGREPPEMMLEMEEARPDQRPSRRGPRQPR